MLGYNPNLDFIATLEADESTNLMVVESSASFCEPNEIASQTSDQDMAGSCFGTFGTFGCGGGCFGSFGTYGCG